MEHHPNHNVEQPDRKKISLPLKAVLGTSAIIAVPYIGDALGISSNTVPEIMTGLHGTGLGSGLAGGINSLLNMVPVVGETLSAGGMATAAASGLIGVSGVLIGNHLDKEPRKPGSLPWGKIIKYSCLTTSLLIALPSILTGLSIGLTYLSTIAGTEAASTVMTYMASTLGATGASAAGAAGVGISTAMTHLLTCGGAALSMCGAIYLDKNNDSKINMELNADAPTKRGKPSTLKLRISDSAGKTLTPDDIKETHTKKIHMVLIDKNLGDYHHIHPEYDSKTGLFTASFTPNTDGQYTAWNSFTLNNSAETISRTEIPANTSHYIAPNIQHTNSVTTDDFTVEIAANPPLKAGFSSNIKIKITDKSGSPAKLEPIMGANAHLVGFSKDGASMIHCHPLNDNTLDFHVTPEKDGFTKFFLQIKTSGRETTIPFGQYIQKSPALAQAAASPNYLSGQQGLAL